MLRRHYPNFNELLSALPDHRQRKTYEVAEIIMAGLMIFVFKRGSKNNADKMFTHSFERNYFRMFGLRLPVTETVHQFMRKLPPEELETLKRTLIKGLVKRRALDKFRFNNRLVVAIDGTGIFSFDQEPFPGCPHRTSKNGKKTWQAGLLEAKIICSNGFSLSMATEWYQNADNIEAKQDCEQKAFVRLAQKMKKNYPRLPIILTADALYPNDTFFRICRTNSWSFILTFKEGCLTSLWEEVGLLYPLEEKHRKQERVRGKYWETSMYISNLEYKKRQNLSWCEYTRKETMPAKPERFVHITDISLDRSNVWEVSYYGRMRWKIENEGFNSQKNQGYNLQHKYAEKDFNAMQNYYQLLQIAHLINQLVEKLQNVMLLLKQAGRTIKSIWEDAVASMLKETLHFYQTHTADKGRLQLRY